MHGPLQQGFATKLYDIADLARLLGSPVAYIILHDMHGLSHQPTGVMTMPGRSACTGTWRSPLNEKRFETCTILAHIRSPCLLSRVDFELGASDQIMTPTLYITVSRKAHRLWVF